MPLNDLKSYSWSIALLFRCSSYALPPPWNAWTDNDKFLQVHLYTFIHLYSKPSTLKMLQQFRQNCRASRWIEEYHVDQYSGDFSSSILDHVSSTIKSTIQQSKRGKWIWPCLRWCLLALPTETIFLNHSCLLVTVQIGMEQSLPYCCCRNGANQFSLHPIHNQLP